MLITTLKSDEVTSGAITLNQRSSIVPVITAFLAACLGFGIGQWRGNENSEQLKSDMEELKGQVKRGTEALTNEDSRISFTDAYRHATAAMLSVVQNQPEEARGHLTEVADLMATRKDESSQKISRLASDLSKADNLTSKKADIQSLNFQLDSLIPRAIGAASSAGSAR